MPTISPLLLGFLRGLGFVVLTAVLGYVGNAANLSFLNPTVAGLIAAVVLAAEHAYAAKTGSGLFGAVNVR